MKPSYRLLALSVMAYAGIVSLAHAAIEYADVTGGRVKGEVSNGLATFKGIPFAAPPVGALRWRVPQPVVPWRGVRTADTFAPACLQTWDEPNPTGSGPWDFSPTPSSRSKAARALATTDSTM